MRVGIVTPAYNVEPWIGAAIRSVLTQTHGDWAMTVVDDGSTDRTAAIAHGFNDPRLRVIRQSNAGVSAARNRGIAETAADAFLFLDADDWLTPRALTLLSQALRANPLAVAAAGAYAKTPGAEKDAGRARLPPSGDLLKPLLIRNLFVNGGHVLIRRAALEQAGFFHTGLRYGEDWEYWTRLARLGPFATARSRAPVLYARERAGGAYLSLATRAESFVPCMDAIYSAPGLAHDLDGKTLRRMRRRAEAENDWIIGRELIRHGRMKEGRRFLARSVRAAPHPKRFVLLAATLPLIPRLGSFRPYPLSPPV